MSPRSSKQFETIRANKMKLILDAALNIFATDGYHSATISKISTEAGISKGLMYNYFSSKEELLNILLGELFDSEMESITTLIKGPFNEETFITMVKKGTEILKKKPKQWMLYFSMSTQPEVLKIIESKFSEERILFMTNILQYFKDKGCKNPELEMQFFNVTMTGFKLSYIMSPNHFPVDEIEEKIINQFIKRES